jgi:hypothetical protein
MCCESKQVGDSVTTDQLHHFAQTHRGDGNIYGMSGDTLTIYNDDVIRDKDGKPMTDGTAMRREIAEDKQL